MYVIGCRGGVSLEQGIGKFFTEDYFWHSPGLPGEQANLADLKANLTNFLKENTNTKVILEYLLVDGDKMAFRATLRRTDPATGKPQHGSETWFSRFVGDKIVEEWDFLGLWLDDA